jgi:hypothetical protein
MPEVRGLPSLPFPGLHRYYYPLRLPPEPAPSCTVGGRYSPSGTVLQRCIRYFPDMPSSLPRWARTSASTGFLPCLQRPSPNIGRVGVHNFTFEACARFTRVTACRFAATLKGVLLSLELQQEGFPIPLSR